jgi:hypothetical protein
MNEANTKNKLELTQAMPQEDPPPDSESTYLEAPN